MEREKRNITKHRNLNEIYIRKYRLRKINGRKDEFIKMEWKKREKERNGAVFSNQPTCGHISLIQRNCDMKNQHEHSANVSTENSSVCTMQ